MSRHLRFAPISAAAMILAVFALEGCGNSCSEATLADSTASAGNAGPPSNSGGFSGSASSGSAGAGSAAAATRAITEADIIQVQGGRLYAMSKSGTVSIVDVSHPGTLALLGQATIAGQPFEMYLRDNVIVAMTDGAFTANGTPIAPVSPDAQGAAGSGTGTTTSPDAGTAPQDTSLSAAIVTLDVTNPAKMTTIALFPVPGELADSRIVGNALYLATYENSACFQCGPKPRTMVTSFDVTNPVGIAKIDQASFASNAPDGYNLPWGSAWKRSIIATDARLYIGGHADVDPSTFGTNQHEGIIDVLDITDPTGKLGQGARIEVAGAVLSRWQMDERDGVLRVISQLGAGRTRNGEAMPEVATFTIQDTQTFVPLGSTYLKLPSQEGLRTVRFDANRAYAITYNQTDPLFTIDLSDPAAPLQRGQLSMPGFMFYLEPYGDRVIGLGVDRTDPNGSLNVSLFDVSNMDSPKMLNRVAFGAASLNEDYAILNYEVPEDQDRIQKAFHVFADGRVAVPFSSASYVADTGSGCMNPASGVQLVSWQSDTLTKDALLPVSGNPRRALEIGTDILAVSDSNVTEFSLAKGTGYGKLEANVVIGTCVAKTLPNGGGGGGGGAVGGDNGGYGGGGYGGYGSNPSGSYPYDSTYSGNGCGPFSSWKSCTVGPIGAGGKTGTLALGLGLALAGVVIRRRRNRGGKGQ